MIRAGRHQAAEKFADLLTQVESCGASRTVTLRMPFRKGEKSSRSNTQRATNQEPQVIGASGSTIQAPTATMRLR